MKQVSKALRDGTPLCGMYQMGKCKDNNCRKGKHLCGATFKSGRVCGGKHSANLCRTKGVMRG